MEQTRQHQTHLSLFAPTNLSVTCLKPTPSPSLNINLLVKSRQWGVEVWLVTVLDSCILTLLSTRECFGLGRVAQIGI